MTSKYRNKRVGPYDSKKEAKRALELELLQKAGEIRNLTHHEVFVILVNGQLICRYEADFCYNQNRKRIVEDVKGVRTEVYKLKKKLMKAVYGIDILET